MASILLFLKGMKILFILSEPKSIDISIIPQRTAVFIGMIFLQNERHCLDIL